MKTTKVISILSILVLSFTSCSGSDDETSVTQNQNPTPTTPTPTNPGQSGTGKFTKNTLIEDYTGTWCGYCPRVTYAIEQLIAQNVTAIPVAIHINDTFTCSEANTFDTQFSNFVTGYPTGVLDRKEKWTSPQPANLNQVKNMTGVNADLGIAMKPTVSSGIINLDVKVKFDANMSNTKLVVYVLEEGLKFKQTNYTSYYGGTSEILNFKQDHTLRAALTNVLGDNITGNTNDGSTYIRNFSKAVPSNITNTSNLSFVAFVLDSNGKVINTRSALLGENQNFQEH